jgi:hypothetical protein
MGQVKVPLKMGFFPFLVANLAIFWFFTLPTCLLSCSKEVLTRLSQKKIIKAEHDCENPQHYGCPPDHGIHPIKNAHCWAQGVPREEGMVLPCPFAALIFCVKISAF